MRKLFDSTPNGGSDWTDEGCRLSNKFTIIVDDFLKEVEKDGYINIRDFGTVCKETVSEVVLLQLVKRRMDNDYEKKNKNDKTLHEKRPQR